MKTDDIHGRVNRTEPRPGSPLVHAHFLRAFVERTSVEGSKLAFCLPPFILNPLPFLGQAHDLDLRKYIFVRCKRSESWSPQRPQLRPCSIHGMLLFDCDNRRCLDMFQMRSHVFRLGGSLEAIPTQAFDGGWSGLPPGYEHYWGEGSKLVCERTIALIFLLFVVR